MPWLSEVMAISSVFTDLRIGASGSARLLASDKRGNPVTTEDLEVGWGNDSPGMRHAIFPNPSHSFGRPGPSFGARRTVCHYRDSDSRRSWRIGMCLKLADYHITESGFGADIGFEKFWNVKCRLMRKVPHVAVITCTVRGPKHHGVRPPAPPCTTGPAYPEGAS